MKDNKDVDSLSHTTWRCQYHVVFAPKYRRMVIYGQIKKDIGQIPYKATVLRLYESNCIKRHKAEELFRVTAEDVAKRVELTGKAKRWQLDGSGTESFGTLLEKADYNTEHDYLTESREKEDWKWPPLRSGYLQRKVYFHFEFVAACGPLQTPFHEWGQNRKNQFLSSTFL